MVWSAGNSPQEQPGAEPAPNIDDYTSYDEYADYGDSTNSCDLPPAHVRLSVELGAKNYGVTDKLLPLTVFKQQFVGATVVDEASKHFVELTSPPTSLNITPLPLFLDFLLSAIDTLHTHPLTTN
uniref:Uncharacterized protein n=1 Tax=Timema monikensis TaxID=170555 RepID=A0A7R9EH67_9NEOP|nr:unnamed protein product [Timema monikensis]